MTPPCLEPHGETPDMRAWKLLLYLPNVLSHPLHSNPLSSHFEDEVNGGEEVCEKPWPRPPLLSRSDFYTSRSFRRYCVCLNRTRIMKVGIFSLCITLYHVSGCKVSLLLVESEWRPIWRETCYIKMSGACPPLLTSLSLVCFSKAYLSQPCLTT